MEKGLSKKELLDKIEEEAAKCERETHGCGRCTLAALMKYFELGDEKSIDLILKAALPLSGGIAQTRNTCGAALGGLMAIGMVFFPGKLGEENMQDIQTAMRLGREYYRSLEKELGHIRCYDIREVGLGRCFDTSDPDEYQKFVKAGGYELCSRVCSKAARLAGEYIFQIKEEQRNRKGARPDRRT
jgi:C_GCAxxG_C_C family probable redox protein